LDIGQLAAHLEERSFQGLIPIKNILRETLKKNYLSRYAEYVRTFHLMTILFKDQGGMTLLRNSLAMDYSEFISADKILEAIEAFGIQNFYDNYNTYSSLELMRSINDKQNKIFEGIMTVPFSSPQELNSFSDPDQY